MDATLTPPPYALLIRSLREAHPRHLSIAAAARAASGLARSLNEAAPDSPVRVPVPVVAASTWEQVEKGYRMEKGSDGISFARPRGARAATLAVMAFTVGATPGQLTAAGRPDAAGELAALQEEIRAARTAADKRRDSGLGAI